MTYADLAARGASGPHHTAQEPSCRWQNFPLTAETRLLRTNQKDAKHHTVPLDTTLSESAAAFDILLTRMLV